MIRIMAVVGLSTFVLAGSSAQEEPRVYRQDSCQDWIVIVGKHVDQCVVDGVEVEHKFEVGKGPVHPQRAVNALRTEKSASKAECLQSRRAGDLEASVAVRFSGEPKSKGDNSTTERLILKEEAPREDCCHPCDAGAKVEMFFTAFPEPEHPATETETASGNIGGTESPYEVSVVFFADRCGNAIEIRQTKFIVVSSTWKTSTNGTRKFDSEHVGLVGRATIVNGVLTDISFENIHKTNTDFFKREGFDFSVRSEFLALTELKMEASSSCELDLENSNEKGLVASSARVIVKNFSIRDLAKK